MCLSTTFLGPVNSAYPLLLNLENDKQTVTVVQQDSIPMEFLQKCDPEERQHLMEGPRSISSIRLPIKVQKIFETPFRNNYVILYLS